MGAGSIGLLYAARIQEAFEKKNRHSHLTATQPPVTLLMRPHHEPFLTWVNKYSVKEDQTRHLYAPVTITRDDETTKSRIPVQIIGPSDENLPNIHTLLLCTKANDAITALASVWNRLEKFTTESQSQPRIIVLSNGALAIKDSILKRFPNCDIDIVFASTTHGAYKDISNKDKYCIYHAGNGITYCTDEDFVHACHVVGWESYKLSDFEMNVMLWKKLAVNCVINPLTAIHGVRNGKLNGLSHNTQDIRLTMQGILKEVSFVAVKELELIHSQSLDTNNNKAIETVQKELSVGSLQTFVDKVMHDTNSNISSMLQDVKAGRVTEVNFLNGYICRIGKEKYHMDCPYNASMRSAVEQLML